ncbi:MAG: protein kinase [Planctomycetes bacterium]|nr:protein kinase [Planctomycetota bacterium]
MRKLKMVEGPHAGYEKELPQDGIFLLGRRSNNDMQVADPKASRVHAEISGSGGFFYVRDMNSRNGTLLNGRRLEPDALEVLEVGDRIHIGDIILEVIDESMQNIPEIAIPGYEILDTIGRGGMGTVYKVRQVSMDRVVAAKVLHADLCKDANFINRFVQEARAAGRLSHPNIIHVFDVDKLDDRYFFTMEYVDGGNVKRAIKDQGKLGVARAGHMILQAARALAYAHSQGVIHRDVKPDNMMLTRDGEVKLADLGIARTFEEPSADGERSSKVYGTPHYMAPEQALGKKVDARADVYSLGASFYHMLTGRTPFTGSTVTEVLKAHVQEALPPITEYAEDVPEGVCHVCERMMAKKPEKRYQNMEEVVADLEKALKDQDAKIAAPDPSESSVIPAASAQAVEFKKRRARRQRPAWKRAVGGGLTLAFFAVLGVVTFIIVTRMMSTPSNNVVLEDPSKALRKEAREKLDEVEAFIAGQQYQLALNHLQDIFLRYPEFSDIVDDARDKQDRVKELLKKASWEASKAALDKADEFYNANPDKPADALDLYGDLIRRFPDTPAAKIGKTRIDAIRDKIDSWTADAQDNDWLKARAEMSKKVAARDYDGAVQSMRVFAARYAGTEAGNKATAEADRIEKEVEEIYQKVESEAKQRADVRNYGMALAVLDQFSEGYGSAKWRKAASDMKGAIQNQAMKTFQEDCEAPNALVAKFEFEEARAAFQILQTRYEGTRWKMFAVMRLTSIEAQQNIHREVVGLVKQTARQGEPPRLPFTLDQFPRKHFRMVSADEEALFLRNEQPPQIQRPFKWVDSFTPLQLYEIYRVYIPNPTVEQHLALGYVCQERDLVEKAEEHFAKAEEE